MRLLRPINPGSNHTPAYRLSLTSITIKRFAAGIVGNMKSGHPGNKNGGMKKLVAI